MSHRPRSARERIPGGGTGKTNAVYIPRDNNIDCGSNSRSGIALQRPATASNIIDKNSIYDRHSSRRESDASINSTEKRAVDVEHTKHNTFYSSLYGEEKPIFPAVLPKSRFPTVPKPEEIPPGKYRRPLICPTWWIDQLTEPGVFAKSDFRTNVDVNEKKKIVADFVHKNRHRMWAFDFSFNGQTEEEICDSLLNLPNFLHRFQQLQSQERTMDLGSSSARIKAVMSTRQTAPHEITTDPFIMSMRTSREEHNARMTRLMTPNGHKSDFTRGYQHCPEYGTFSTYNHVLMQNSGAVLKR